MPALHVFLVAVQREAAAAAADVDPLRRSCRRVLVVAGAGPLVVEQVRETAARARVARPTDDRRRRRLVRQAQLAR